MRQHPKKPLYTLIELLVTITVIGILSSLLISVLKISKEKTKTANCNNNLRSIGAAYFEHFEDFRTFPAPIDDNKIIKGNYRPMSKYEKNGYWYIALGPYLGFKHWQLGEKPLNYPGDDIKDPTVDTNDSSYLFICPSATKVDDGYAKATWELPMYGYGMNRYLPPSKKRTLKDSTLHPDQIKPLPQTFNEPSELPLNADSEYVTLDSVYAIGQGPSNPKYYFFDRIRHEMGANMLYCDGRVSWSSEETYYNKIMDRARTYDNWDQDDYYTWGNNPYK